MTVTVTVDDNQAASELSVEVSTGLGTMFTASAVDSDAMVSEINDLSSDRWVVGRPIPVVVWNYSFESSSYVASMSDANVNASGDTPQEAINNLKDVIAAKMTFFSSRALSDFGKKLRKQYSVLRCFIYDG